MKELTGADRRRWIDSIIHWPAAAA